MIPYIGTKEPAEPVRLLSTDTVPGTCTGISFLYLGLAELDEPQRVTRYRVDHLCNLGLVTVAVGS